MKNGITVIAGVLLVSLAASAQDTPKMETFLGFTYLRANSASNVPAFSANGGGGQFAYNFNKWLGGVADMGAVHNGNIGGSQTSFAMTTGGGLDIKLTKHMTLRPIGLDYYMTRLQNLRSQSDNNQHNLRYTTGINFTFGAQ